MSDIGSIADVKAYPMSYRLPATGNVRLGIGMAVKRDAVIVKVVTSEGLVGYGESHHGRAPGTVAHLVNTTLRDLVLGMDAADVVGVWKRIYAMQLASHGLGTATAIGMSGIDIALWDIRGKAMNVPLYRLLGGTLRRIPVYAGGISLGFQDPSALINEVRSLVDLGYQAIKLRVGDTPENDVGRVTRIRETFGDKLILLVDANTGYTLNDIRQVRFAFEESGVYWLEEPFAPHDHRSYSKAASLTTVPLAAGENHYTRFEFSRVIEDGSIHFLQPDITKTGGLTEAMRIAATASTWKLPIHPHTSATGISMAATIHFLCAIENGGFFEGDASQNNPFRDELVSSSPYHLDSNGFVRPLDGPGIGLEINMEFIERHPLIDGPCYV